MNRFITKKIRGFILFCGTGAKNVFLEYNSFEFGQSHSLILTFLDLEK